MNYTNDKINIREITDKIKWDDFIINKIASGGPDTFLQSWNWGEFNMAMDNKIWRFGIFEEDNMLGAALAIKITAKRGTFILCPHLIASDKWQSNDGRIWKALFDYLKLLAEQERADFLRICPLVDNNSENIQIFQDYGFKNAPIHMMHPEFSWILDISKSEDDIIKGMRKTHRNLIRRAEREGVIVDEVKNLDGIEKFYNLHEETVGRHGFIPFSRDYLKEELDAFAADNMVSIFFANYHGKIISAAIIVFYGGSAFYHHGASTASKIPASYFLMWRIIQESKKRGCKKFNFWGIAPENKPKHPWAGLSLFKTGFGGYRKEYLHCQDLPLTMKYWLNYAVEKIRRIKRGY